MISFKVDGMSCNHCVQTVTKAVHTVDKAADVQIDLATGMVRIESRAAQGALESAIADSGFEVIGAQN